MDRGGGLSYYTAHCNHNNVNDIGVPANFVGFQYAHTGVSYAGLYTYLSDTANYGGYSNYRGYIQAQLNSVLQAGMHYYLTFYVNLADSMNYACNDIGAYFSDSALSYSPLCCVTAKFYLTPQIANDPINNPLTDALNWIKVSGSFMASGGEKYIIIGNFKPDSTSNSKYLGFASSTGLGAYYYIDDVIVSPDSNYADSLECALHSSHVYADAGRDTTLCAGGQALLGQDSAVSWAKYSWQPAAGLANPNSVQTFASPNVTSTYTLRVVNDSAVALSCPDSVSTDTVTVFVCNQSLFVPNAFSPNNDGYNDVFLAHGNNIQTFYMAIYDRWGNKVFESNNINDGWDGKYNGQPENTGTYVYYIKGTYDDGTDFEKKGNVALVR